VVAALGALAVGGYFGVASPLALRAEGYQYAAIALAAAAVPLVLFLGLMALAPGALQKALRRVSRADLRDTGHAGALVILAGTLFFVLGYGALVNGIYAYEHQVVLGRESEPVSGEALFTGLTLNVIVLVLPVLLYVGFVYGLGPAGTLRALGMGSDGAMRAAGIGAAATLVILLLIALASAAILRFDVEVPENELALEIARSVTLLGAFGIATGAAFSEEIFFRGFLQPRLGLWGQAVLFALAHLSYVNVLQVVVTFVLGLAFGVLYQRTRSLWAPIAAHFLFNFLMLVAGIYAPEPAA
jgi:uncharacterized protein